MAKASRAKLAAASAAWRSIFDFIIATSAERNQFLGESGLTPNDARALVTLTADSGRTMGSLAREWRCDASTATWIVDRLEAKRLVERRPHPTDRRVKLVVLTPLGERAKTKQLGRSYLPPKELLELDLADLITLKTAVARLPRVNRGQTLL